MPGTGITLAFSILGIIGWAVSSAYLRLFGPMLNRCVASRINILYRATVLGYEQLIQLDLPDASDQLRLYLALYT